ncbi:Uncharacterised protein [uncultured archaeon]|nr:Uncharacterised protein [uncultured archaeon]
MGMQKRLLAIAFLLMVCLLALPNIDYDSQFRLHVATDFPFRMEYVHSQTFLPVYQFLLAIADSITALRIVSIGCVLISAIFIDKIMQVFCEKKVAQRVAALFLFNPLILLYGSLAMSESLATLIAIATIYLYVRDHYKASAVALTLGVLTSYWIWVFTPFFLLKGMKEKKFKYVWFTYPIVAIVAWGIINYTFGQSPIHFVDMTQTIYQELAPKISLDAIEQTSMFLFVFPMAFTLGVFLFSCKAMLHSFKNRMHNRLQTVLVYFAILYTALLSLGTYFGFIFAWGRYFIPLIPTFLMLGAPAMLATETRHRRILIAAYFSVALIATVIEAWRIMSFQRTMGQ